MEILEKKNCIRVYGKYVHVGEVIITKNKFSYEFHNTTYSHWYTDYGKLLIEYENIEDIETYVVKKNYFSHSETAATRESNLDKLRRSGARWYTEDMINNSYSKESLELEPALEIFIEIIEDLHLKEM